MNSIRIARIAETSEYIEKRAFGKDSITLGKDVPYSLIDDHFCRVKTFLPHATIDKSKGNPLYRIKGRVLGFLWDKTRSFFIWSLYAEHQYYNFYPVVRKFNLPYATITLESPTLRTEKEIFVEISNESDFRHLSEAFEELDANTQEVIFVYHSDIDLCVPKRYLWWEIFYRFIPKLHVFVYKKGGLEKIYDGFGRGLAGYLEAKNMEVKEWEPLPDMKEI